MKNKYPLLSFKEPAYDPQDSGLSNTKYDLVLGYWVCDDGEPVVSKMISRRVDSHFGPTTKSTTREGVDQSETVMAQTIATRSREGIDQSETVFAQTMATKSREGVDQSESAVPLYDQTRITETREGVDRSENSSW